MWLVARCGIFSAMGGMARLVRRVLFFIRIRSWISLIHSDGGKEDEGRDKTVGFRRQGLKGQNSAQVEK